jgi:hypothetical protein
MNDFDRDYAWQLEQRDTILAPHFYGRYALDGRYVTIDKGRLGSILQKRFAVDTVVQGRKNGGASIFIEEKIVRWPKERDEPYTSFCFETKSCTVPGRESDGWMVYGQSDCLDYAFQMKNGDLDNWLLNFPKTQEWFWPREKEFSPFLMKDTINKSAGRVVPIQMVQEAGLVLDHRLIPCGGW